MKKLFVFDWNGTLLADTMASWKASNVCLEHYGAPAISMARFKHTFNFPVLKFYEDNGVPAKTVLADKESGNIAFQSSYEALAAKCRLRHGGRALLQHLNDAGYDCIILSNYLTTKIESHLDRLKIRHHFKDINAHDCDGTTILQSTTKVLRLRDYMDLHGYNPAHTSIIGDSMEEPEIAQELGLTSFSITGGGVSEARLKKAGADYLVGSLATVKNHL
jgi:phosphoglycolate phosphatase